MALTGDPSIRWHTLTSDHFYVHYYDPELPAALRVVRSAERAHQLLTPLLRYRPGSRTHIVLTDDVDTANGSASAVPLNVIRLFLTSPENLGTLNDIDDWLNLLVIHEYTHILHIDNISGIARWVNRVFGKIWAPNQIQPRWFIEGLAVYEESRNTSAGRERSALFDMYLRAAVLEGRFHGLDEVSSGPLRFPQGTAAYLYGARFLQYLAERFGEDKLARISTIYGGQMIPYALNRIATEVLGVDYVTLWSDFRVQLQQRYERQRREVQARGGPTSSRRLTFDGQTIQTPRFRPGSSELLYFSADGRSVPAFKRIGLAQGRPTAPAEQVAPVLGGGPGSFTPDGRTLVFQRSEVFRTVYQYDDLFALDVSTRGTRRLTVGARAHEPDVSPDGARVAFSMTTTGDSHLAVMALPPATTPEPSGAAAALAPLVGSEKAARERTQRAIEVLVRSDEGEQVYTPAWSPDGRRIAYSAWKQGGYRDLFVYDLDTRSARRLTFDRAIDLDPRWTPDGRTLLFSSDRTGIYNLFALELETGTLRQVTDVVNGAFQPCLAPDGRTLVYLGFSADGYDLHATQLPPRIEELPLAAPYVSDREGAPMVASSRAPLPRLSGPTDYQPWSTLWPRSWNLTLGQNTLGTSFTAEVTGTDVVGNHSWGLAATYSSTNDTVALSGSYVYWRLWPQLSVSGSRFVGQRGGFVLDGRNRAYTEESLSATAAVQFPILRRTGLSSDLSIAYSLDLLRNRSRGLYVPDPNEISPRFPETGTVAGIELGWSYSSAQRFNFSISPQAGRTLVVNLRFDHEALGSDYRTAQASWRWTEYLTNPWWRDHVLALRYAGGAATGNFSRRGLFAVGGVPPQDVLRAFFEVNRVGGLFLHGYPQGGLIGDQFHLWNAEYRFPVVTLEQGYQTVPLYVRRVHAAAYADYGAAFSGSLTDTNPFRLGVGGELRIDMVLGYVVANTFQIGYARGLSQGGEGQLYFVLGTPF
jgi:Tol biopolymer transport system component